MGAGAVDRRVRGAGRLAGLPPGVGPARSTVRPPERLATGIASLDRLLDGGVPRGAVSEVVGGDSAGRTAIAAALLAAVTRRGELAAWFDPEEVLDPESLLRGGGLLRRVLWVRPRSLRGVLAGAELVLAAGGFGLVVMDLSACPARRLPSRTWPRLLHRARAGRTALVLLGRERLAGSFAALSLHLVDARPRWSGGLWRRFEGLEVRGEVLRNRWGRTGTERLELEGA